MRFVKQTSIVLALCMAAGSTAALAGEQENAASCMAAAKQVSVALSAQQMQNAEAARQEKRRGLEFCNAGFYHQGMVHYAKALELLGADKG